MSDFGTIIIFKKKKGIISDEDLQLIKHTLKEIVTKDNFPSNIYRGNFLKLRSWDKDTYASFVTEYYHDYNTDELKEWAKEDDLPNCDKIIDRLTPILGNDFTMKAKLEEW